MIFVAHVKTPANTPATDPLETVLPVVHGTITLVSVQFPPGCNALAHLAVNYGLYQLFPTNQEADFASGGETIDWDEDFTINTDPAALTIYSWNEDTTYDHTITVRVVMQPANKNLTASQAVQALFQSQSSQAGSS